MDICGRTNLSTYEDIRIDMLLFQKGDYVFSFDLKSGYHHIDIFEPYRQFLGFCWDQGAQSSSTYSQFCHSG